MKPVQYWKHAEALAYASRFQSARRDGRQAGDRPAGRARARADRQESARRGARALSAELKKAGSRARPSCPRPSARRWPARPSTPAGKSIASPTNDAGGNKYTWLALDSEDEMERAGIDRVGVTHMEFIIVMLIIACTKHPYLVCLVVISTALVLAGSAERGEARGECRVRRGRDISST